MRFLILQMTRASDHIDRDVGSVHAPVREIVHCILQLISF